MYIYCCYVGGNPTVLECQGQREITALKTTSLNWAKDDFVYLLEVSGWHDDLAKNSFSKTEWDVEQMLSIEKQSMGWRGCNNRRSRHGDR